MVVTVPLAPYTLEQSEDDVAELRGLHDGLSEYAEIGTLVGNVVAQQPGTSTSPQTQETWHPFNPLSNSWTVPAGGLALYRLTVQNELQISATIQAPGISQNNVTIATFPVGYRPVSTHGFPVFTTLALNNAGGVSPGMTITSAGVMQAQGITPLGVVSFEVKIPLDV